MTRHWRYADKNNHYYFQGHDGRVIGQVYNIALTIVWGAKIPISANEELMLGQYIELEFAKKAIEEYWDEKDRTFDVHHEHLLSAPRS
jgi:hypothetical protein